MMIWLIAGAVYLGMGLFWFWLEFDSTRERNGWLLLFLPYLTAAPVLGPILYSPEIGSFLWGFSTKGVLCMKRKLFVSLFLLALGGLSPRLFDGLTAWYNAPPAPPSPEAQRLIASLEATDGWEITHKEGFSTARVKRGNVEIKPGGLWCDLYVNGTDGNGQFSVSDLRAVDRAAKSCLRKLTARALDQTAAAK